MKNYLIHGITGVVLTSFTGCADPQTNGNKKQPNIIFILADDLGYNELGCYGQKIIQTPHIDSLAANGIRFTQYYSGSPVCAPSRYSLLTGKHIGKALIRANYGRPGIGADYSFYSAYEKNDILMSDNPALEGSYPIRAETNTIGKVLQRQGYTTSFIGKWGLGGPFSEGVPSRQGFDHYFGYLDQGQAHNYYPLYLWRNDEKVFLDNKFVPRRTMLDEGADPYDSRSYERYHSSEYAPALMLDEAVSFIQTNKDEPFFLYFATIIPHMPFQAPKEWVDKYRKIIGDEEPFYMHQNYFPCQYPKATYAAMISYFDYQIGHIIQELKNQGIYENTIIMLTSDNGPQSTSAGWFDSASPFRSETGYVKGTVYEGGIRVPLIVSWPDKIKNQQVSNHICAAWDVFPTLGDVSGAKQIDNTDGISIMPSILQKGKQKDHLYLYWELLDGRGQQAVRMGNWKGIREGTRDGKLKVRLYNLDTDIREEKDVADEFPEIVKQIEEIMKEAHQKPELKRFDIFDPVQTQRVGEYPRHPNIRSTQH